VIVGARNVRREGYDLCVSTSERKNEENEGEEKRTEVGDGCVLSLTRSVGDHDTPSVGLSELSTVDSKRENEISAQFR